MVNLLNKRKRSFQRVNPGVVVKVLFHFQATLSMRCSSSTSSTMYIHKPACKTDDTMRILLFLCYKSIWTEIDSQFHDSWVHKALHVVADVCGPSLGLKNKALVTSTTPKSEILDSVDNFPALRNDPVNVSGSPIPPPPPSPPLHRDSTDEPRSKPWTVV